MEFFKFVEKNERDSITYYIPYDPNIKFISIIEEILSQDKSKRYFIDTNVVDEDFVNNMVIKNPKKYIRLDGVFNWNKISLIETFDDFDEMVYNGRIDTLMIPAVVENRVNRIKRYNDIVNEEVGFKLLGSLKGFLQKAMSAFAEPFKDLASDIKKAFSDPDNEGKEANSIKSVILTNVNQALDGAQKVIPSIQNESDINAVMENFIKSLIELGNNLDSDFSKALGKESIGPKAVAKAVILGDKNAKWPGLVGILQGNSYKFNKTNFETTIAKSAAGKTGKDALNLKVKAAQKFFDDFQKDLSNYINKELNEDELQVIFNKAQNIKTEVKFKIGDIVSYKKEDFDDSKSAKEQPEMVTKGEVRKIDGNQVVIFNSNIKKEIKKSVDDIIVDEVESEDVTKKAQETLGKIKDDKDKMSKVTKFADFIQDPKNSDKISEIEKILNEK